MRRQMRLLAALAAVGLVLQAAALAAGIEGRYRIELLSGQYVEGDVTEQPDGSYKVKTKQGVVVIVKKNEVRAIRPMEGSPLAAPVAAEPGAPDGGDVRLVMVSDAEVEALLEGITAEPDASLSGAGRDELMVDLPVNEDSLAEMKRVAGPAAKVLLKPHFAVVYTSDDQAAKSLAARLEAIYRWKIQFLRMMNAAATKPEHKMEIYYFGTNAEFLAAGGSLEAAGYYRPDDNRSYFFNALTHPTIAPYVEKSKDKNTPADERQRLRARINRFVENSNLTTVQHECGHHLDFNLGLFPRNGITRKAGCPRWLVEGTTQMFEVPPSSAGASLGVLNHQVLDRVRAKFGKHPLSLAEWTSFLFDDRVWFSNRWGGMADSYPLGWSMVYYLWTKHRTNYGLYCKKVLDRDDDTPMTTADCQAEFEGCFGRFDEKWLSDFYKFLDSLQLKKSLLLLGESASERAGQRGGDSGRRPSGGQQGGRGGRNRGG